MRILGVSAFYHDSAAALFGGPARKPESPLAQRHMDLAASVQAVVEEAVLRLTRSLREETGIPYLCLAGGVALNCVANGKVLRDGRFDDVMDPACGGRRWGRAWRRAGGEPPSVRRAAECRRP